MSPKSTGGIRHPQTPSSFEDGDLMQNVNKRPLSQSQQSPFELINGGHDFYPGQRGENRTFQLIITPLVFN